LNPEAPPLFEELFKKQQYKCKIFGKTKLELEKLYCLNNNLFCLDHNHKVFKIRGIICHPSSIPT
jgi:hypothetical protein